MESVCLREERRPGGVSIQAFFCVFSKTWEAFASVVTEG